MRFCALVLVVSSMFSTPVDAEDLSLGAYLNQAEAESSATPIFSEAGKVLMELPIDAADFGFDPKELQRQWRSVSG